MMKQCRRGIFFLCDLISVKRNTQNTMMVLMLATALALLGGCDSGLGGFSDSGGSSSGSGSGSAGLPPIRIVGSSSGRAVQASHGPERTAVPAASENLKVSLTLTGGPGGPHTAEFGSEGGTMTVTPGTWTLTAEARSNGRLRAFQEQGPQTITINEGGTHSIAMKACIGVSTYQDLDAALEGTLYTPDRTNGDLIVLENDITYDTAANAHLTNVMGNATIIATLGQTRTITGAAFSIDGSVGASLTLGRLAEP